MPVIFGLLAACGQASDQGDTSATETDSSTQNQVMANADNTLTDAEKNEGWQLLFDGTSKTGWHTYLNRKPGGWNVANGELYIDSAVKGGMGESILTDSDYENFHLKIDWKISKGGNSGIMFGVKEDAKYEYDFFTGPEYQVLDDEGYPDPLTEKQKAGALYDLIAPSQKTSRPAGEWNTAEIIKNKDTLEFRLNGPTVVKTTMWNDDWKKMVADSKFKAWPDFGTFKSGKISLQDHGNVVWYKNIKIRPL